jgi:mRNA-degrading endonuclease RelE of RelBE toxin-antitoxin system
MKIQQNYKKPFTQFVKKQSKPFQAAIEDEVLLISENPELGELKVGDLAGIRVYKFKFNRQEYLIAYSLHAETIEILLLDFYKIGTHENFYTELKKYLKT